MDADQLVPQAPATFRDLHLYERGDLQRLLRHQPEALGEDLIIVSEEFGNWEDSRRRIDLLALDQDGKLVVIELKRTDDGGHMELQALRYAAMVSSMTFDEVVEAHTAHHSRFDASITATRSRELIAEFLESSDGEIALSTDVRIILVSADFGREITTAVLWLNRFEGLDLRCIRLKPYEIDGRVILDIEQVLPLPEAADYQIKIGRKEAARARTTGGDTRDFTKYVIIADGTESPVLNKRNAVLRMVQELVDHGVRIRDVRNVVPDRVFRTVAGEHAPGEATIDALLDREPQLDFARYFTNAPFHEADETHVMFRMWGRNTEPTLESLSQAFSEAGVTFRAVRPDAR
ncbi:hypothetical protein [Curtobacterium sp. RRHDQ10]|uniref:hypothetical protein n=1 Tax=Curtobacterium phyllosphaerae TaxID=3413379 RepID=UPI003BF161DE